MLNELLSNKTESSKLDVKEMFVDNDHGWIELVKDIAAFANRQGGAIVFGVQDNTFNVVGCNAVTGKCLGDPNNIKQKLSKYIKTDIPIDVVIENISGVSVLGIIIKPVVTGIAVFDVDGSYTNPSGAPKVIFLKGQIVIRGDAGNEILSSSNQHILRDRLILEERERIISGITKIVVDPAGYKLVSADKSEGKKVVFTGGDPNAHKVTFDVGQTGRLYEDQDCRDALEMLRTAVRADVDIDKDILARHIVNLNSERVLPIDPECLFCMACKCTDIPRFLVIGYNREFSFTGKTVQFFHGCSSAMQKGRLISAIKVIDKGRARELTSLLKSEERRQLGGLIKIGTKQEEDDHSCVLVTGIKDPLAKANGIIQTYLTKIANRAKIEHNEGRKAVALDYMLMKAV